jgi:hypothetical protein
MKSILKTAAIIIVSGILFATATGFIAGALDAGDSMAGLVVFIYSSVIGNPLGVIAGIFVAKHLFHLRGSIALGIIGTITGAALVFVSILTESIRRIQDVTALFIIAFAVPELLGIACFLIGGKVNLKNRMNGKVPPF